MTDGRRSFGVLAGALPLAAVVIEFCWLYPWLLFATGILYGPVPTPLLPAWPAFLLLLGGAVAVRRIAAMPWSLPAIRITVVGAGFLLGLIAVKTAYYSGYAVTDLRWVGALLEAAHDALPTVLAPVAAGAVAALLWWRGVALGGRDFSYVEIDRLFRGGLAWTVMYVTLYAIYADTRAFAVAADAPVYLLAFFSLSLLSLAVARLIDLWTQTHADERQAWASNRHWLMLLVGVVGLIVLAAVLLSGAMPSDLRPTLGRVLSPLLPVVEVVFYAIFAIALVIARLILFIWSRFPRRGPQPLDVRTDPLQGLLRDLQELQLDPGVVSGARWGMVLLVVILLSLLIAIAIVRTRRRRRGPEEDERESVWSTRAQLAGLGSALRSWWARLRPAPGREEPTDIAAIRQIYRELLRWAAAHGAARRPEQTPYEFLPQLRTAAAPQGTEASAITEVYVAVRYTQHEPTRTEVDEARRNLEDIVNRPQAGRDPQGPRP